MRVVLWCTATAMLAFVVLAAPAQAGFPDCRDVTEHVPSEYLEGRYVYPGTGEIEFWQEWNGYAGLQRQKCTTETGVILGRDTYHGGVDYMDPEPPEGFELPGFPQIPDAPELPTGPEPPAPTLCGAHTVLGIAGSCVSMLEPPETPDSCNEGSLTDPDRWVACTTGDDEESPGLVLAYVNWLQFVTEHITDPTGG